MKNGFLIGVACVVLAIGSLTSCKTIDNNVTQESVVSGFPVGINVEWIGPNGANAQVVNNLKSVEVKGGKITYKYDKLNWPDIGGNIDSILCAFFMRNGNLVGGKFEWSRPGMTQQKVINLTNGYIKKIMPLKEGEEFYFCLITPDGKIRTNVLKCNYYSK